MLEYNLFIPLGRPRQDDKFRYSIVGQFFNNLVKGLRLADVLHMLSFLITVSGAASIRASNALLIVLVPEVPDAFLLTALVGALAPLLAVLVPDGPDAFPLAVLVVPFRLLLSVLVPLSENPFLLAILVFASCLCLILLASSDLWLPCHVVVPNGPVHT